MIPLSCPDFSGNEADYLQDALASGRVSSGPYVDRFEDDFGALYGLPAVSCSSGTAALHLALLASGIGPGDEVLVPDLTFAATAAVVKHVGATPVLVDVDDSMFISAELAKQARTERTKAVIAVHLYGLLGDVVSLKRCLPGLIVIEDAAETIQPYRVHGDYACFSFYGNKAITTGEGGMVLTNHPDPVRLYRSHGMTGHWQHPVAGLNYRMTNLQAAVGCAQIERWGEFTRRRLKNWGRLVAEIGGRGTWMHVVPKRVMQGVETRPVFAPIHILPPYRSTRAFPMADKWAQMMCLPCGPHLSAADLDFMMEEYNGESVSRLRSATAG